MKLEYLCEDLNLLFDYGTNRKLCNLLKQIPDNVTEIYAAVAYTSEKNNPADFSLVDTCIKKNIKLNWWGLFDYTGATDFTEITKALEHPDLITFYPYAEKFHSKVIYMKNYGIYIGSHNFTYNAMMNNVEAGVFIKEESFTDKQKNEIDNFFNYLKGNCIPAVSDDLDRIKEFIEFTNIERLEKERINRKLENYFGEQFSGMFLLKGVQENSAFSRDEKKKETLLKRKKDFIEEWRQTQNIIEHIKIMIKDNCIQPKWVKKDASYTVITDQVLHAYFYSYILKGSDERKSSVEVMNQYQINKGNSDKAIMSAINWWQSLENAPSNENIYINDWGITNNKILSNLRNRKLTRDELLTVFLQNHAARNHARQINNKVFGLEKGFKTNIDNRVEIYTDWLLNQKSKDKLDVNDVLKYLLFDGKDSLEDRVFNCIFDDHYRIEHFGRSIIGEILGWGRPDITHIRNNRVNKALRCLGYDVELFSE